MNDEQNRFSHEVKLFFQSYLPNIKGLSPNTMLSYRDTLKFYFHFLSSAGHPIDKLDFCDFSRENVLQFLDSLEQKEKNSISTRNIRLAGIHAFFKYISFTCPEQLHLCQQILAIPFKKGGQREVEYFTYDEICSILEHIDQSKWIGKRDFALILFMFNTGARAQEVVDLRVNSVNFEKPYLVSITGKGRKQRTCPLWQKTVHAIKNYLEDEKRFALPEHYLFVSASGASLTRFGLRYILKKRILLASSDNISLKKKNLHPHSMRHSTGVYLLKAKNDLSSIANWLGHADINTTTKYAKMDFSMKKNILRSLESPGTPEKRKWPSKNIVDWLESL